MAKILIIANARRGGGLSGGDSIYLNLVKYAPPHLKITIWDMLNIDFKPFTLCYIYRILASIYVALRWKKKFDIVYSASDFWMDSLPAFVFKLKGCKWIAGFYLFAPRERRNYYYTQKLAYWIIKKWADVICITNRTMKKGFMKNRTVEVNGGVDLTKCKMDKRPRTYDAVFVGRIHETKGIEDLIDIWCRVRKRNSEATLGIIGAGDMGLSYLRLLIAKTFDDDAGITLFGFMDESRYEVYKSSKMVLYPTRSHFSMSPVEAMACGCPMITYKSEVMNEINPIGVFQATDNEHFAELIEYCMKEYTGMGYEAREWAYGWAWPEKINKIWGDIYARLRGD